MPNVVWSFGLKELSEFGCRFGWHVSRSRCKCLCSCFCTNYKYGRWTLGDNLDNNHLNSEAGLAKQTVCLLSVMACFDCLKTFIRNKVLTEFRLTQDSYGDPGKKRSFGIRTLYENISCKLIS